MAKNANMKNLANINNSDFLNYMQNNEVEYKPMQKGSVKTLVHIRMDIQDYSKLKQAAKITRLSYQVLVNDAIINYLKFLEKELEIDLSEED